MWQSSKPGALSSNQKRDDENLVCGLKTSKQGSEPGNPCVVYVAYRYSFHSCGMFREPLMHSMLLFLVAALFLLVFIGSTSGFSPSRPHQLRVRHHLQEAIATHGSLQLRYAQPASAERIVAAAQREDVLLEDVCIWDIVDLVRLSTEQFKDQSTDDNGQDTLIGYIKLKLEIFRLFLPKIFFKDLMGHALIGLKKVEGEGAGEARKGKAHGASGPDTGGQRGRKRLIGFVDLSLQRSDGSLDALKPFTMEQRRALYPVDALEPYLCNLLVEPQWRGRGYGQLLIASCEQQAVQWGRRKLFLHVDVTTKALQLYLKTGFKPIRNLPEYKVMFMGKDL